MTELQDDNYSFIGDTLIDTEEVSRVRLKFLQEAYQVYKKASTLLGYFSQLRDYDSEYQCLCDKVSHHRKEILTRYKDLLIDNRDKLFKSILVAPSKTEWFIQGIHKYKKVKNYSTYYYRRQFYVLLEQESIDLKDLKKLINTISIIDKYYNIYEETIGFFMQTSTKFEQLMRRHFSDHIHL